MDDYTIESNFKQLQSLKAMTINLGTIHDAQVLHLKMWPLLIKGVKEIEMSIDTENRMVSYNIKAKKGFDPKDHMTKETMKHVRLWIQQILWPDTGVVYLYKGKKIDV